MDRVHYFDELIGGGNTCSSARVHPRDYKSVEDFWKDVYELNMKKDFVNTIDKMYYHYNNKYMEKHGSRMSINDFLDKYAHASIVRFTPELTDKRIEYIEELAKKEPKLNDLLEDSLNEALVTWVEREENTEKDYRKLSPSRRSIVDEQRKKEVLQLGRRDKRLQEKKWAKDYNKLARDHVMDY